MKTTKKCIILSRVSTLSQDLTQQTEVVINEAIRFGYDKKNIIIIEDKESAVLLSEEERNGLNTLKYHVETDKSIDCVFVYEVSRISRKPKIVYSIRDYLIERKIQLIVMNPYCKVMNDDGTLSETSNILFGIFATMAENEGYIRKARLNRGRMKKKAMKKFFGHGLRFGYDIDEDDNYIPHTINSKKVIEVFERYVNENVSQKKLAKQLFEEGFFGDVKHETCLWYVVSILKDETYLGERFYPQIVPNELFEAARVKRGRNLKWSKEMRDGGLLPALLRGILHVEDTDRTMTLVNATNQYLSHHFNNENTVSIHKDIIEPLVWFWTVELHKKFNSGNKSKRLEVLRKDRDRIQLKITNISKKIDTLIEKIDKIEERWINGKITESKRDSLRDSAEKELNELQMQKTQFASDLFKRQSQIHKQLTTKLDYDNQTFNEQRSLILETIRKITIKNSPLNKHNQYKKIIKVYNNFDDSVQTYLCDAGKFIRSRNPFRTITKIE